MFVFLSLIWQNKKTFEALIFCLFFFCFFFGKWTNLGGYEWLVAMGGKFMHVLKVTAKMKRGNWMEIRCVCCWVSVIALLPGYINMFAGNENDGSKKKFMNYSEAPAIIENKNIYACYCLHRFVRNTIASSYLSLWIANAEVTKMYTLQSLLSFDWRGDASFNCEKYHRKPVK